MALQAALSKFQSRHGTIQQEMVEIEEGRTGRRPDAPQASGSKRSRSHVSEEASEDNSLLTDAKGSGVRTKLKGSAFRVRIPKDVVIARRAEPPVKGKVLKDGREYLRAQEGPVAAAQLEKALNFSFAQYPDMRDMLASADFVDHDPGRDTFAFRYDERVVDKSSLLRFLKANPFGKSLRHVKDLYPSVDKDVAQLQAEGRVLLLAAVEEEQRVVYPLCDQVDAEREKAGAAAFDAFLAQEFLATALPRDAEALSKAYRQAFSAPGKAVTAVFERVVEIKPEKQRQRKARAWQMDKVTNAHMPELFAGVRATQIDSATY
jgi:hypothetical protein